MAHALHLVGIVHPQDLIGKDPFLLYNELCRLTEKRHDPCVIDVFMAVVHFMDGGDPTPWWKFTHERKRHLGVQGKTRRLL